MQIWSHELSFAGFQTVAVLGYIKGPSETILLLWGPKQTMPQNIKILAVFTACKQA